MSSNELIVIKNVRITSHMDKQIKQLLRHAILTSECDYQPRLTESDIIRIAIQRYYNTIRPDLELDKFDRMRGGIA